MTLKKLDLKMTSQNTPSPYVVTDNGIHASYYSYYLFDDVYGTNYHSANGSEHWVQIFLGKKYLVKRIKINTRTDGGSFPQTPNRIIMEGSNDGINFTVILDKNVSMNGIQTYYYDLPNNYTEYSYYKLKTYSGSGYVALEELGFYVETDKYLIKLQNEYFSTNPNLYNPETKSFTLLIPNPDGTIDNLLQYGFPIESLNTQMTINGETFKPIDKLRKLNRDYKLLFIKKP